MTGTTTTNIDTTSLVDDLLGNRDGSTVRISPAKLAAQMAQWNPQLALETYAELAADLDWPDTFLASVWGDANTALNGVYQKSGDAGTGSWTRIGALPTSAAAQAALNLKADKADLGSAAKYAVEDFATKRQGEKADAALPAADMAKHKTEADQHAISGVTGLTEALDGKTALAAFTKHKTDPDQHPIEGIAGLRTELDGKASSADGALARSAVQPEALAEGLASRAPLRATSPGEVEDRAEYVLAANGKPENLTGITSGEVVFDGDFGRGLILSAEDIAGASIQITPRRATKVEAGRVYRISARVKRLTDAGDPLSATVTLQLQRLAYNYVAYDPADIAMAAPVVSDGVVTLSATVSTLPGHDIQLGAATIYIRPMIEIYDDADQVIALGTLAIEDVTDAVAIDGKVGLDDARLTDPRDWDADIVSQAEAQEGTGTAPRKWTAARVRQAAEAWALANPSLGGIPTAPLAPEGDQSAQIANTAWVTAAINALIGAAPDALTTINDLAAALQNDPDFAVTITDQIATKLDKTDPSVTDARDWTAETVSQTDAEAGTSTARRAWSALRVAQAIAASAAVKLPRVIALPYEADAQILTWTEGGVRKARLPRLRLARDGSSAVTTSGHVDVTVPADSAASYLYVDLADGNAVKSSTSIAAAYDSETKVFLAAAAYNHIGTRLGWPLVDLDLEAIKSQPQLPAPGGTASDLTIARPAPFAVRPVQGGDKFWLRFAQTNGSPLTIDMDGTGPVPLNDVSGAVIPAGTFGTSYRIQIMAVGNAGGPVTEYRLTQPLYSASEKSKLAGVEDGATGDQTGAEIKAALLGEPDTNILTDAAAERVDRMSAMDTRDVVGGAGRDRGGHVAVGVLPDGSVTMRRHNEAAIETGSDSERMIWGLRDANGYVALGVQEDGRVMANLGGNTPGLPLSASAILGMTGHNVWGASNRSTWLRRYWSDADAQDNFGSAMASYVQRYDIASETSVTETDVWRVIVSYGQSVGIGGGGDGVYTVAAPHPRQAMMLSTGTRGTGTSAVFDASAAIDIAGAHEAQVGDISETPASGFMIRRIAADRSRGNDRRVYLYHASGSGGTKIEDLQPGTQPYLNMLAAIDQILALAERYGARVEVECFIWTHGEANSAMDPALYQTYAETIFASVRSEFAARGIVPEGGLPILMDQLCAPSDKTSGRTPNIAFYAIEAADPLAFVSCPKYQLQTVDGLHPKMADTRLFGEYIAQAADAVINDGSWTGCRITGATLAGDQITVSVHVPQGDLVADTTTVPAALDGNLGFLYEDDTSSATITGVTIGATVTQSCTVTLQLSAVPSGTNPAVSYAYDAPTAMSVPYYGVMGNLRDSAGTVASVPASDAGDGYIHNWLLIQPPIAL